MRRRKEGGVLIFCMSLPIRHNSRTSSPDLAVSIMRVSGKRLVSTDKSSSLRFVNIAIPKKVIPSGLSDNNKRSQRAMTHSTVKFLANSVTNQEVA